MLTPDVLTVLYLLVTAATAQPSPSLPAYQCMPIAVDTPEDLHDTDSIVRAIQDEVHLMFTQVVSLQQQIQALSSIVAEIRDNTQLLATSPPVTTPDSNVPDVQQPVPTPSLPAATTATQPPPPSPSFSPDASAGHSSSLYSSDVAMTTTTAASDTLPTASPLPPPPTPSPLPTSCTEAARSQQGGYTGYYTLNTTSGLSRVFCDFDLNEQCGGEEGWLQVAYLNMSDPFDQCPPAWAPTPQLDRQLCGRRHASSCNPVSYSTSGMPYSRVCGRIVAYAYGTPNGFEPFGRSPQPLNTTRDVFIDGVVVTKGGSEAAGRPPQHVWSFVAGLEEAPESIYVPSNCPCSHPAAGNFVPAFVGKDYFCEAGSVHFQSNRVFLDNALWDGDGCQTSDCCSFNNPPWFSRAFASSVEDLQVGLCADSSLDNEDTLIELLQLYVQ